MKKMTNLLLVSAVFILSIQQLYSQGVGVNSTGALPDSSAMLDISSTAKGLLIPRMTEAEKNAIVNPAFGLTIFNITDTCFYTWAGTSWYSWGCKSSPTCFADAGSDVSICKGTGTGLTASGGGTYLWSTGGTSATINVSPTSTTTYTVTVADGNGCTAHDDVLVTVNALPTTNAGVAQTICNGGSTTLTGSGGGTYLWNTGATTASVSVNPTSNITYTLTVTVNGCTDDDQAVVTVNTLPTATISINYGADTTLTGGGGVTYSWSTGATLATITVHPTANTTYTLTVTDGNGCTDTDNAIVTVSSLFNCGSDLTDSRNGKIYKTVKIGTQCWMAENLNYGTRRDAPTPQINNGIPEKYCYGNIEANCDIYGGLYQWNEMMDYHASSNLNPSGVQGICPLGWHLPSHYEWTELERTVCTSGSCVADFPYDIDTMGWRGTNEGRKLKSCRTVQNAGIPAAPCGVATGDHPRWDYFSGGITYGTDDYGFSALPGGNFFWSGTFFLLENYGTWWTATGVDATTVCGRAMDNGDARVFRVNGDTTNGFSVRCIKD